MEYSILVLQRQGTQVDWFDVAYYGPFASKEERESWEAKPENQLESRSYRYKTEYLLQ